MSYTKRFLENVSDHMHLDGEITQAVVERAQDLLDNGVIPQQCAVCGDDIPLARLEFMPHTKHCVKCADVYGPKVYHDPNALCAKASQSCQNGFAPNDG